LPSPVKELDKAIKVNVEDAGTSFFNSHRMPGTKNIRTLADGNAARRSRRAKVSKLVVADGLEVIQHPSKNIP
jgi:hypothetical protein